MLHSYDSDGNCRIKFDLKVIEKHLSLLYESVHDMSSSTMELSVFIIRLAHYCH